MQPEIHETVLRDVERDGFDHAGAATTPGAPEGELAGGSLRWVRLALLLGATVALGVFASVSAVIIVASIVVMVFFHELGHYLTAKWAGMKVTQFFIGFGPRIWSFHRGETEYGIKAIPAGAYVRIVGMTSIEEVAPQDEQRTYRQKSYWRRLSVAVAGSTMHFVMAIMMLFGALAFFETPVGTIFGTPDAELWEIGGVAENSAASAAGFESGDKIVAIDGEPVSTFERLGEVVRPQATETLSFDLLREGQPITLDATIGLRNDGSGTGLLGVTEGYGFERVGIVGAAGRTVTEFGTVMWQSLTGLVGVLSPSGLASFFGLVADTSPSGETAVAPAPDTSAPAPEAQPADDSTRFISLLGLVRIGADIYDNGFASFLLFMVMINVFIGLFNLIPLLPLDGGHVAIATYEKIREVFRGDGRRYLVDITKLMPLTYAVVFLLVGIGVSSIYLDVVNPIQLNP